jgi:hypothetical protein
MILAPLFAVPAVLAGPAADVAAPPVADLEALAKRMVTGDGGDRLAAAKALAAEPPSGIDLYAARLLRPRTIPADTFRQILLEIWAQVPNTQPNGNLYMQKPEPPWTPPPRVKGDKGPKPRRPPPHDPEKVDWLEALAALDLDGNPTLAPLPDRTAARGEALEAVALMHALAASGRAEAVDPLFDFAFAVEGVFRDECGRNLRTLGPPAVPGLIRHQYKPGKNIAKQHRYAAYQLDRMDRARPSKALQAAPDDRIRAEILHAYGEAHALDAVAPVLGEVDASARQVRREARAAWLGYVAGPAPPSAPKRKRKLPGGQQETEEKEDYLNYREMATLALDEKVNEVLKADPAASDGPLGKAVKDKVEIEPLTRALFAYYDARRSAEWDALYQAGVAKRKGGDLAGAIADFSSVLAHDPFYEHRAEMAEAFVASAAERPGHQRALLLRQAVALAPDAPDARHLEAEAAFLDGDFRRTLALEPEHAGAKAAFAQSLPVHGKRKPLEIAIVVTGSLGLLILLIFAGGRGRARRLK